MSRMGLCLVGLGRIAQSHLSAIAELKDILKLRAVVTRDPDKGKMVESEYGAEKIYASLDKALEDPEIEAVDICLPHHLHADAAISAAKAGKHVFIEKPLARNLEEADRIIEAAKSAGVKLMVGQSRRFTRATLESKKIIEEGTIGEVCNISCTMFGYMSKPAVSWWESAEKTGGFIMPLWGAHLFDYVLWVYGKKPVRAYCEARCLNPEKWEGEDEVMAVLGFDKGEMACVQMSWNVRLQPEGAGAQLAGRMWSSKGGRYERVVIGKKGTIVLQDDDDLFLNGEMKLSREGAPNNFRLELEEFGRAILEGREPMASGREIRSVVEVIDACQRAARTHEVISLE